jgi:hypothetical protein
VRQLTVKEPVNLRDAGEIERVIANDGVIACPRPAPQRFFAAAQAPSQSVSINQNQRIGGA